MASIRKRINKSNETTFSVEIRLRGFPAQRATFKRLTDAKRWARDTESSIQAGRYLTIVEAKKHTLEELVTKYIEDVLPEKRSSKSQEFQLKWWSSSSLGSYLLSDITTSLINEQVDILKKETSKAGRKGKNNSSGKVYSAATVNRYLAALSHVFTKAVRKWQWCEENPVLKVDKLKEPDGRIRFLTDDERRRLLNACKESSNQYLYVVVVLALSSGMRQAEIMTLQRHQVDLSNNKITLYKTKNNEIRVVPLVGLAHKLLSELPSRVDTQLLFPSKKDKNKPVLLRSVWANALKAAKIEDFRFHDLRHTAASAMAMNGASLLDIAKVLGHKSITVTQRYAHLTNQHTEAIVSSMNDKMFGELT